MHLNWNVVEKRIRELIAEDKYLSPKAKEAYAEYKKEQEKEALADELEKLVDAIEAGDAQEEPESKEADHNPEFGPPVGRGENSLWSIVHEADDENDNPQEWATKLPSGQYVWIDREEDGSYGIHPVADSFAAPTEIFRTLEEAQEYVDEAMRGDVLKEQALTEIRLLLTLRRLTRLSRTSRQEKVSWFTLLMQSMWWKLIILAL